MSQQSFGEYVMLSDYSESDARIMLEVRMKSRLVYERRRGGMKIDSSIDVSGDRVESILVMEYSE